MMLDDEINKGAIRDHIYDIAFELYKIIHNTDEIDQETKNKLCDICMKTDENKTDEYADFISEELTDEIKKNDEKLGSFMEAKVYALIPKIENYLIKHYDIFSKN